jgi:putative ABC transport system substrate-binding protein
LIKRLVLFLLIPLVLGFADSEVYSQVAVEGNRLVTIVCSDSSLASIRSLKGIRQTLMASGLALDIEEVNFKAEHPDEVQTRLSLLKPDLIISVGSRSTLFIKDNFADQPLVFSTVLNPETSGILDMNDPVKRNVTGASLDIPVNIQFQKFKLVNPGMKKIGVVYTAQTEKLIEEAQLIVTDLGLELVSIRIESDKELPRALDSLCRVVDGIWTTPDDFIYTPQATKFMILICLRNHIPIMGFTPSFVESGALLGLNYDYKDIGRRAGELAVRYLKGEPMDSIPIAPPGVIYLHINLKTANQLGIDIDQSLVDISKEIYK